MKEEEKGEGEEVGPVTALLQRIPVLPRAVRERLIASRERKTNEGRGPRGRGTEEPH